MKIQENVSLLLLCAFGIFLVLSVLIAIVPAAHVSKLSTEDSVEQSEAISSGREIYLSEGCATCHTQFVRELAVDAAYGRGSIAADYVNESPPLLGTQRTGPDLSNTGQRQPSETWNLIHLYNPRVVVKESVMPAYPWLFEIKKEAESDDVLVPIPDSFVREGHVVVATEQAINLVKYLQSLKQEPLQ